MICLHLTRTGENDGIIGDFQLQAWLCFRVILLYAYFKYEFDVEAKRITAKGHGQSNIIVKKIIITTQQRGKLICSDFN